MLRYFRGDAVRDRGEPSRLPRTGGKDPHAPLGPSRSEAQRLRPQCTQNKAGRRVRRHVRQDALDRKHYESRSTAGRRDIRTRQHLMERSFARSKRYGYDRARWRGLWRVEIQELLTCTVQNIQVLVSRMKSRPAAKPIGSAPPAGPLKSLFAGCCSCVMSWPPSRKETPPHIRSYQNRPDAHTFIALPPARVQNRFEQQPPTLSEAGVAVQDPTAGLR